MLLVVEGTEQAETVKLVVWIRGVQLAQILELFHATLVPVFRINGIKLFLCNYS